MSARPKTNWKLARNHEQFISIVTCPCYHHLLITCSIFRWDKMWTDEFTMLIQNIYLWECRKRWWARISPLSHNLLYFQCKKTNHYKCIINLFNITKDQEARGKYVRARLKVTWQNESYARLYTCIVGFYPYLYKLNSMYTGATLPSSFTDSFTKQLYIQPHQTALRTASPNSFTDSLTKKLYGQPHQTALRTASPNSFTDSLTKQLFGQPHQKAIRTASH